MMARYYDKNGTVITDVLDWAKKFKDMEYMRVAETTLADGTVISTVWLGLDHSYEGPPLIFETMVFPSKDDFNDRDMERYSTLVEAEDGHRQMVAKCNSAAILALGAPDYRATI